MARRTPFGFEYLGVKKSRVQISAARLTDLQKRWSVRLASDMSRRWRRDPFVAAGRDHHSEQVGLWRDVKTPFPR